MRVGQMYLSTPPKSTVFSVDPSLQSAIRLDCDCCRISGMPLITSHMPVTPRTIQTNLSESRCYEKGRSPHWQQKELSEEPRQVVKPCWKR